MRSGADQFRERLPKRRAVMDNSERDVLAYKTFTKAHWSLIDSASGHVRDGVSLA